MDDWHGIYGNILKSGHIVEGLVWISVKLGITGNVFTVCAFIFAALFACATGSGFGTISTMSFILYPAGILLGSNPAVLAGAILITFLKNADRVKVACLAQLVNVIAPLMTRNGGGVWAQTIFYPMMHASRYGRGTSLRPLISSPVYDCRDYEKVPLVDAAAVRGDDGSLTIFALNRDLKEDILLDCDLRAFGDLHPAEHIVLHHDDVKAVNTEDAPDEVSPVRGELGSMDRGRLEIRLPALSWNVIRLA